MTPTDALPLPVTAAALAIGRRTFDVDFGAEQANAAATLLRRTVGDVLELAGSAGDHGVVTVFDELDPAIDEIIAVANDGEVDSIVVLQSTFADARTVIRLADATTTPIVVWSFPEQRRGERLRLNSLCGANLAAYSLRRRGHPATFVHADPGLPGTAERLRQALSTASVEPLTAARTVERFEPETVATARAVVAALDHATVGVIGERPDGFEPCEGDDRALRRRLGVTVEHVALDELFDTADATTDETVASTTARMTTTLLIDPEVRRRDVDASAHLYGGLRTLADRRHWTALSTRCWPECMTEYGGAVCTPQAMLTEDGIPAVCEADVVGSITALLLQRVAGSDPFVADLVDVDLADNTSVLWHCGVAPATLAAGKRTGVTHPNRGVGLVSQFAMRPGRVTMARLSQAGPIGDGRLTMVIGEGRILDRPRPYSGTCGVVEWDRPAEAVLTTVFDHGLEHHLAVVYGDHRDVLAAVAAEWGLPVVELGRPSD